MTPRARAAGFSRDKALKAPRNLKAPMRWKFSHLKNTVAPMLSFTVREVSTGVRWAWPSRRLAAASTSVYVGELNVRSKASRYPSGDTPNNRTCAQPMSKT
jgi:hypothetical protein